MGTQLQAARTTDGIKKTLRERKEGKTKITLWLPF
jgi:hypothetical protein